MRPIAVFPDGTVLIASENRYDPRGGAGVVRDSLALSAITPTGETAGAVARLGGADWLLFDDAHSFRATQLPFGRRGFVEASGDRTVYASSESPRLLIYDRTGRLLGAEEIPSTPRKLSRDEVGATLSEIPDEAERRAIQRHLAGSGGSMRGAAITDLRVDSRGNVWVRTPASGRDMSRWTVYSLAGRTLGSVLMQSDHLPLDLRDSVILVREVDQDGVQRVAVREIVR